MVETNSAPDKPEHEGAVTLQVNDTGTGVKTRWADSIQTVFICGFPSSGTDLLKNIINAHTAVFLGGEFPLLARLARHYNAHVPRNQCQAAWRALHNSDVYKNFDASAPKECPFDRDSTFSSLFAELLVPETERRGIRWVGNKTPQNTEHIEELTHLFPDARFILIMRDVRDVALSWERKWGKDPVLCAAKWNQRMLSGVKRLEVLGPARFMVLRYEELLQKAERVERSVCEFLGLEFQERMLEFSRHVRNVVDGKLNYGQPIQADNTGKWGSRMSPALVKRIEEVAYEGLKKFHYDASCATHSIGLTRLEALRGRLIDLWSTVIVGNRAIRGSQLRNRLKTVRVELSKRLPMRK